MLGSDGTRVGQNRQCGPMLPCDGPFFLPGAGTLKYSNTFVHTKFEANLSRCPVSELGGDAVCCVGLRVLCCVGLRVLCCVGLRAHALLAHALAIAGFIPPPPTLQACESTMEPSAERLAIVWGAVNIWGGYR